MDNITSCLVSLFSSLSQSNPSTQKNDDKIEKYNSDVKEPHPEDSNIHIKELNISHNKVTFNVKLGSSGNDDDCRPSKNSYNSSDYTDDELEARMRFFKANSP